MYGRTRLLQIAFLIALVVSTSISAAQTPSGVKSYVAGGDISYWARDFSVTIPDTYRVLDIDGTHDRLLVTAYSIQKADGIHSVYRSEVWAFKTGVDGVQSKGFDDRQVLVSFTTSDGESKKLCLRTVSCKEATAVYVDGWEHGHTLLFDKNGVEVDIDWPRRKAPTDKAGIDYIRPLTWIEDWSSDYKCRLVCWVSGHGDLDPFLAVLNWQTGEIEMESLKESFGSYGFDLLSGIVEAE